MTAELARIQADKSFVRINEFNLLRANDVINTAVENGLYSAHIDFERSEISNYVNSSLKAQGYKTHFYYDDRVPMLKISW